jgi:hypothetical protein
VLGRPTVAVKVHEWPVKDSPGFVSLFDVLDIPLALHFLFALVVTGQTWEVGMVPQVNNLYIFIMEFFDNVGPYPT